MASIVERKKNGTFAVVYYATVDGKRKQVWETFTTQKEANKRKREVENEIEDGTYVAPSKQTISEFLQEFVALYGEEKWALSTYSFNIGLIDNYINPLIGDVVLQNVTPKFIEQYYKRLRKSKPVETYYRKPKGEFVGPAVLENVHKLLRCAFGKAVKWEVLKKNPFELVDKPKTEYAKRDIWNAETIIKALDECRDGRLYLRSICHLPVHCE